MLPPKEEILYVFHVSQVRAAYNPTSHLWLLKEVQSSVPAEELHIGRMSIHASHGSTHKRHPVLVHGLTKSKGNHPVMTLRPPSNTKQCLFVPFMLFIQRQVQFIHFEVLWKQEPKWVILWHRTSAKSFQLVQADILRTCFSSIKVSSDDLLYNTGRRRLSSHRVGSWGVLKANAAAWSPCPRAAHCSNCTFSAGNSIKSPVPREGSAGAASADQLCLLPQDEIEVHVAVHAIEHVGITGEHQLCRTGHSSISGEGCTAAGKLRAQRAGAGQCRQGNLPVLPEQHWEQLPAGKGAGQEGRPGPGHAQLGTGPGRLSGRRVMGGIQGPGPREAEHHSHPRSCGHSGCKAHMKSAWQPRC